jgi:hypothetical protein
MVRSLGRAYSDESPRLFLSWLKLVKLKEGGLTSG